MQPGPRGTGAWMAKVGEKGQIVIPKQARDLFGIKPGDTLLLLGDKKRGIAIMSGDKMLELAGNIFGGAPGEEDESEDKDDSD